jgi:hypothetical protein
MATHVRREKWDMLPAVANGRRSTSLAGERGKNAALGAVLSLGQPLARRNVAPPGRDARPSPAIPGDAEAEDDSADDCPRVSGGNRRQT